MGVDSRLTTKMRLGAEEKKKFRGLIDYIAGQGDEILQWLKQTITISGST